MERFRIFLITAAMIAGTVGCGEVTPLTQYNLTISSTEGGSVTAPGEVGPYTYDEGEVVNLVAEADEGYQFVNWTCDVDNIVDVNAATTTITMQGDYEIIANFALAILEIRDWYDLDAIKDNSGGSYVLMNDLDSTTAGYEELASVTANGGSGWEPIGTGFVYPGQPYVPLDPFTGSFDGHGYEIRDLFIDRPDETGVGLFGVLDEGGVVQNLRVVDAHVAAAGYVGGLVGWNEWGTVSDSYFSGNVAGRWGTGGLTGANRGTVSSCCSNASVVGGPGTGGLTGDSFDGALRDSYFTGSVTGDDVGGLVGWNAPGTVSNCHYNYHEVLLNGENIITIGALFDDDFDQWLANDKSLQISDRLSQENGCYVINNISDFKQLLSFGQDPSLRFRLGNNLDLGNEANFYIPYLAGEFDGNCHRISDLSLSLDSVSQVGLFGYLASSGKVTQVGVENVTIAGYRFVGGLVGGSSGTVSNSYSTGSMSGSHNSRYVGGLVGWNAGTVGNSYSSVSVTGDMYVGGLMGGNQGTVTNSHSTGSVTGAETVGGLVGGCEVEEGTVSHSFWDIETSRQATSDGGTGLSTLQMKSITTFSDAGWNIFAVADPNIRNPSYIWNIVDGQTYPFLSWQPVS